MAMDRSDFMVNALEAVRYELREVSRWNSFN